MKHHLATREFLSRLVDYSGELLKDCAEESEKAVNQIHGILQVLMEESARISKMSPDTRNALSDLKDALGQLKTTNNGLSQLAQLLKKFPSDDKAVMELIMPIVEALQFQDFVRQQMESLGKISQLWVKDYGEDFYKFQKNTSEKTLLEFGTKALKCTVSQGERDIIRKHIPSLPPEEKVQDMTLF